MKFSLLAAAVVMAACSLPAPAATGRYIVYVGTYTGPQSKGIYAWRFDPEKGALEPLGVAGEVVNPSWVTIHPNRRYLYAVSELGNDGRTQGAITAFSINRRTGALTKLNSVSSRGGGACHLVVDKTGKSIAVANYGSGSTAVFRLQPDGSLGESTAFEQHSGSSNDRRRQRGPHAHAVVLSADNRFLFVPDLGLDKVMIYRFDAAHGTLAPNEPPFAPVKAATGPRHFAFHPSGRFAYALSEMGSCVTAFAYDRKAGSLRELQNISTLPADFRGEDNSAEIAVDAAGRFLYASNRGHDSITLFAIDPDKGTLTTVEQTPTQGKMPRNFAIDPTGRYLFAANQKSDNIVIFRRDIGSGRLTPTGQVLGVSAPVSIQFVPAE